MNILPQYIGVSKMSSWYPECSGKESNLSSCLVQHRDMSVVCSAKRVIITCFPITMDPETDLPLCGFEVSSSPTTQTNNFLIQESTTALAEPPPTKDVGASFLIFNDSYSGISTQRSDSTLIIFCLGVATAAVLLCGLKYC